MKPIRHIAPLFPVLLGLLAGCGGSSGSSSTASTSTTSSTTSTTTTTSTAKFGGSVLSTSQRPTADMTLAQSAALPVGMAVAVSLDRNNPTPTYYVGNVMGYDALDQLVWVRLSSQVTTPSGEGDSGSPVFTLPTTYPAGSPNARLNGLMIGSLSYGYPDNDTDFLVTPISMIRKTGGSTTAAKTAPKTIKFNGKTFRSLATPIYYQGIPDVVLQHVKKRAPQDSPLQNIQPMPVLASNKSNANLTGAARVTGDSTDPFFNNTIVTFLVRGDVVFSGATGSVTATDGPGWLAYGHPFQGGGAVDLATCSGTVVNMFYLPVSGTYKLANPTNVFDKTMTWDGINGVRIEPVAPKEITLSTKLLEPKGNKAFTHHFGYDGVVGDLAEYLTLTTESAYLAMYDTENDLVGTATMKITTVIKGQSTTVTYIVPATSSSIFFGYDPNDPNSVPLDSEIYETMTNVESSGDRTATVDVSMTVDLAASVAARKAR